MLDLVNSYKLICNLSRFLKHDDINVLNYIFATNFKFDMNLN